MSYNARKIETAWQQHWEKEKFGEARLTGEGKKFYCLDMFPYPSGAGLHIGHWRGYVLSDVYARMRFLQGYNVLHPMGWDAFGLPAENYAIQKGVHPRISTEENIANFKRQLRDLGAMYDWSKELDTTDPDYYKWTQWIFLKMYKAGLAYEDFVEINWCPVLKTGISNEEVIDGRCERSGAKVEKRKLRHWMLRITSYAEKLLEGLDRLEWPERVKTMQRNWIGKSVGLEIQYKVKDTKNGEMLSLPVFTTCPETLYGVTFLAVAADHQLSDHLVTEPYVEQIEEFRASLKSHEDDMYGVFTGSYVANPITGERLPIYLANFVLKEYGTGIVQAVPAHDERDYAFAEKYNLPIRTVIQNPEGDFSGVYTGDGLLINSDFFNGMQAKTEGRERIASYLINQGVAEWKTNYRLRDWVFSRQRYWGEPIPLVHCGSCGIVPVPEDELPVRLPDVERYEPTGTGESPLAGIEEWVNTTCPSCGGEAKRETNTMPQWAGSCWYFLRYPNAGLTDKPFDQKDMRYWLPVDLYVGGIEHAILHLLYARFYVKVLHDLGYLSFDEPFKQLFNQGMITRYSEKTRTVEKMSKSKGNVVNPDEMVAQYGSDSLRLYILFMGPPELDCEWQDAGLAGMRRFLNRFWTFLMAEHRVLSDDEHESLDVTRRWHVLLKEFADRIDNFKPNTAVSAFMEWLNDANSSDMRLQRSSIQQILTVFSSLAPHFASDLLEKICAIGLESCVWPTYDPALVRQERKAITIQVNGRKRGIIQVKADEERERLEKEAKKEVAKWLVNKTIARIIYVPNVLVNFVVE